jgi:hypothetical protein
MKCPLSAVTASHRGGGCNRAEYPFKSNSLEFSGFTRQAGLTVAELTDYYHRSEENAPDGQAPMIDAGEVTVLARCRVNCHWRLS